ncbi:hypothetical protein [uncultured Methanolobus sp.]|nr:hypothetical protein [uncultured Methanolobus sp.]
MITITEKDREECRELLARHPFTAKVMEKIHPEQYAILKRVAWGD